MEIGELNKKFGINKDIVFVTGKGSFPCAELSGKHGKAVVCLYGAHVLSYVPAGEKDVLWNTSKAVFESGKPIRGGIPVCWPWFGPHATDSQKPMHGFARLLMWEVIDTSLTELNERVIKLKLTDSQESRALWPYAFEAVFTVTLGKTLKVELSVTNTSDEVFSYTDALHTYFSVADVSQISILGLKGASYYDGTDKMALKVQDETFLKIEKEENRRYLNTAADCIIDDPLMKRHIKVTKENSNTTVVWNPWIETSKTIGDMNDDDYKTMVCVEAVNAFNEVVTVRPGESFAMSASISIG